MNTRVTLPHKQTNRKRGLSIFGLLGLFFCTACWATWPTIKLFDRAIPTGDSPTATVPYFNAWSIWWNAEFAAERTGYADATVLTSEVHDLTGADFHEQNRKHPRGYFDAPIFSPQAGAFAYSEPQPLTLALAPVTWWFDLAVAYNVYLFGSLLLNGFFAFRLLRYLECHWSTTLAGSVAIVLHPLAIDNLEAVQLLPLWGIMWTLECFSRLLDKPKTQTALLLGSALAVTGWMSVHHLLLLLIALVPTFALLVGLDFSKRLAIGSLNGQSSDDFTDDNSETEKRPDALPTLSRSLLCLSLSAVVATLLLLPIAIPMQRVLSGAHLERSSERVQTLSAELQDWRTPPPTSIPPNAWLTDGQRLPDFQLMPGIGRTVLALLCLVPVFFTRNKLVHVLICFGLCSWFLSFGSNVQVGQWTPWESLSSWFSPIARIRSPYRFAYFTQIAIIMLATKNADQIIALASHYRRNSHYWVVGLRRFAACVLVLFVAFETPPPQTYLRHPPLRGHAEPWLAFIASNVPPESSILCLPVAENGSEQASELSVTWMLYATQHKRPILNGYSGFLPEHWINLSDHLRSRPSSEALESPDVSALLKSFDVSWIVIRRDSPNAPTNDQQVTAPDQVARRADMSGKTIGFQLAYQDRYYQIWQRLQP